MYNISLNNNVNPSWEVWAIEGGEFDTFEEAYQEAEKLNVKRYGQDWTEGNIR